jgi:DNA-binding transcriptional ArsR family regulator
MSMKALGDVQKVGSVHLDRNAVADLDSLAPAASLFRSLGDPSRLAILGHLALGEHKVRELTEHLGLAQSTVSAHLRCLLDCGLVQVRAVGRSSVYSLAVEDEVLDVLRAAEELLAATGDAVLLCPRYGRETRR